MIHSRCLNFTLPERPENLYYLNVHATNCLNINCKISWIKKIFSFFSRAPYLNKKQLQYEGLVSCSNLFLILLYVIYTIKYVQVNKSIIIATSGLRQDPPPPKKSKKKIYIWLGGRSIKDVYRIFAILKTKPKFCQHDQYVNIYKRNYIENFAF